MFGRFVQRPGPWSYTPTTWVRVPHRLPCARSTMAVRWVVDPLTVVRFRPRVPAFGSSMAEPSADNRKTEVRFLAEGPMPRSSVAELLPHKETIASSILAAATILRACRSVARTADCRSANGSSILLTPARSPQLDWTSARLRILRLQVRALPGMPIRIGSSAGEQRALNPRVGGSIPPRSSTIEPVTKAADGAGF